MLVKLERIAAQAEETAGTQTQSQGREEGGTGTKGSPFRLALSEPGDDAGERQVGFSLQALWVMVKSSGFIPRTMGSHWRD